MKKKDVKKNQLSLSVVASYSSAFNCPLYSMK